MTTNAYRPTSDLVHDQIALYEANDGREGGTLECRPVVILTTIGAKTGNLRKNPVMRLKDGDREIPVMVLEPAGREQLAKELVQ